MIKESTRFSMMKNDREHIFYIINNLNKMDVFKGIRIYNKKGRIEYTGNILEFRNYLEKYFEKDIEKVISITNRRPLSIRNS